MIDGSRYAEKNWVGMSLILIVFIYFNSKFKATRKNEEFECRCIKTHSRKKSKICITSVAILFLFFLIKMLVILNTLEFTLTIKHDSKWFIFAQITQIPECVNFTHVTYTQPIWVALRDSCWRLWVKIPLWFNSRWIFNFHSGMNVRLKKGPKIGT